MSLAYPRFGKFLNETGRPILYSCSWPDYENDWYFDAEAVMKFRAVAASCNTWRMYRDIYARWDEISDIIHFMGERQHILQQIAGPGQFNDADQLIIGDHRRQGWCYPDRLSKHSGCYGLTEVESKTMMALWCIWATPLLMSNDLTNISAVDKAILQNKKAIAGMSRPVFHRQCSARCTVLSRRLLPWFFVFAEVHETLQRRHVMLLVVAIFF